jgi:hypothetical protein
MPVSLSSSNLANPTYKPVAHPAMRFASFREFYPFYLGEHAARANRIMHLTGTSIALSTGVYAALCTVAALAAHLRSDLEHLIPKSLRPLWGAKEWLKLAITATVQGYAWAWVGHALIEKNRPATFKVRRCQRRNWTH